MATPSEEVLKPNGYGDRGCQIAHRVYDSFREFCYPMTMCVRLFSLSLSLSRVGSRGLSRWFSLYEFTWSGGGVR